MATKKEWIESIIYQASILQKKSDEDMPEALEDIEGEIDELRQLMKIYPYE